MSEVVEKNDYVELVERLSIIQSKIALGKELDKCVSILETAKKNAILGIFGIGAV